MKTVTLTFINQDARPKQKTVFLRHKDMREIVCWYSGYHAGDDYVVYVDGVKQELDRNGEIVGEVR